MSSSSVGKLVSLVEKESPQEGVRAWEVVWRLAGFLQVYGPGAWWSPVFRWLGTFQKKTESKLSVRVIEVNGVEWLQLWHGTNTKTKGSVSLLGRDQAEHHTVSEEEFSVHRRPLNLLPWKTFVDQKALLTAPDGSCTLIYRFKEDVMERAPSSPASYGDPSALANHFGQLYTSRDKCDLKILVSDQVFPVHRAILAARSPAFASMLGSDMAEANSGEVYIQDSAPGPVDSFLRYLYTGNISSNNNIPEILRLADKYLVDDLKVLCVKALSDTLSLSNTIDYLKLSYTYSLNDLQKRILILLKEHKEILNTKPWKALQASDPALTNYFLMELLAIT